LRRGETDGISLPDLVVLDLNLPRMNGHEVLAAIKKSAGLKHIPVVIMTSSRADEDVSAAYLLNANCYVTKPSDFQQYMNVIRAIEDFWFFTASLPQTGPGMQTFASGARPDMVN
jgi:two-component system, chemotaxis family, response regulator Rcp1